MLYRSPSLRTQVAHESVAPSEERKFVFVDNTVSLGTRFLREGQKVKRTVNGKEYQKIAPRAGYYDGYENHKGHFCIALCVGRIPERVPREGDVAHPYDTWEIPSHRTGRIW